MVCAGATLARRPGHPLLVDPVRAGRPARGRAVHRRRRPTSRRRTTTRERSPSATSRRYLLSTESFQLRDALVGSRARPLPSSTRRRRTSARPLLRCMAGILPQLARTRTPSSPGRSSPARQLDVRAGQRIDESLGEEPAAVPPSPTSTRTPPSTGPASPRRHAVSDSLGSGADLVRGLSRPEATERAERRADRRGRRVGGRPWASTDFEYSHYRTLAKIGLSWHSDVWKTGLIDHDAQPVRPRKRQERRHGVPGRGRRRPRREPRRPDARRRDGRRTSPAHYQSSWAVGAGASRAFGATRFYASAEWYAPVARFSRDRRSRGIGRAKGELSQELGNVLNAGVGAEHVLNGRPLGLRRVPHRLLRVGGSAQVNVARLGLGHLPRERRRVLPHRRQPVHPGGVLGAGRQDARPRHGDTGERASPRLRSGRRLTSTIRSSRSSSGSCSAARSGPGKAVMRHHPSSLPAVP